MGSDPVPGSDKPRPFSGQKTPGGYPRKRLQADSFLGGAGLSAVFGGVALAAAVDDEGAASDGRELEYRSLYQPEPLKVNAGAEGNFLRASRWQWGHVVSGKSSIF